MATRNSRRSSTGIPNGAKAQLRVSAAPAALLERLSPRSSANSSPRNTRLPPGEDGAEKGAGVGNGGNGNGNGGGSSSITVVVRVRPLSSREVAEESRAVVQVLSPTLVAMLQPTVASTDYLRQGRQLERRFAFDAVCGPDCSQSDVYRACTTGLLPPVLQGFEASIFAYGATGSGKTYSMSGTSADPGIMVLTLVDLFVLIDAASTSTPTSAASAPSSDFSALSAAPGECRYEVSLSLLEIYNENIRDLLTGAPGTGAGAGAGSGSDAPYTHQRSSSALGGYDAPDSSGAGVSGINPNNLELREDPQRGMVVAGITSVRSVRSAAHMLSLLESGNRRRTTEPTRANEVSSRSHQVLQIVVERHEAAAAGPVDSLSTRTKIGRLTLVDLAGSERASKTENRGARLVEGANINRSLLALANVISGLARGQQQQQQQQKGDPSDGSTSTGGEHVPFRDSKLTRLLKRSLTEGRTVMLSCASPAESSTEETLNTLKYADRAKSIKTKVESNERRVGLAVREYEKVVAALRGEILTLKQELWAACSGLGSLRAPIAAAPQHRLSRIPSVARGSFSGGSPAGSPMAASRALILPALPESPRQENGGEGGALASSATAAAAAAAAAAAFRSGRDSRLLATPSRLQQPTLFFADVQAAQLQAQAAAAAAAAQAQGQLQAQLQQAAVQHQPPPGRTQQSHGQWHRAGRKHRHGHQGYNAGAEQHHSIGGGAGGVHLLFPALAPAPAPAAAAAPRPLNKREKMELFLQAPERAEAWEEGEEDIAAAFAYLRTPSMPTSHPPSSPGGEHDPAAAGAAAAAPAVVLPASLGLSLRPWPFGLLRGLLGKVRAEEAGARGKLVQRVLRPSLALRSRLGERRARVRALQLEADAAAAAAAAAGESAPAEFAPAPSPLLASLLSETEALVSRLGLLEAAGVKLSHKILFKSALAELVETILRERIERAGQQKAEGRGGRARDGSPVAAAGGGGADAEAPPSNAKQMMQIETRSFHAAQSRLLQAERDLRSALALLAAEQRVLELEHLALDQGRLLRGVLLPRLATAEGERRREVEAVEARAAGMAVGVGAERRAQGASSNTAPLPLIVSPSAARAAIRMQPLSPPAASAAPVQRQHGAAVRAASDAHQPGQGGARQARSHKKQQQQQQRSNGEPQARSRSRRARGAVSVAPSPQTSPTSGNGAGGSVSVASSPAHVAVHVAGAKARSDSKRRGAHGEGAQGQQPAGRSKRAAAAAGEVRASGPAAGAAAAAVVATPSPAAAQARAQRARRDARARRQQRQQQDQPAPQAHAESATLESARPPPAADHFASLLPAPLNGTDADAHANSADVAAEGDREQEEEDEEETAYDDDADFAAEHEEEEEEVSLPRTVDVDADADPATHETTQPEPEPQPHAEPEPAHTAAWEAAAQDDQFPEPAFVGSEAQPDDGQQSYWAEPQPQPAAVSELVETPAEPDHEPTEPPTEPQPADISDLAAANEEDGAEDSDARYVDPFDEEFEPELEEQTEDEEFPAPPPALDRDFSI